MVFGCFCFAFFSEIDLLLWFVLVCQLLMFLFSILCIIIIACGAYYMRLRRIYMAPAASVKTLGGSLYIFLSLYFMFQ